MPVLHGVAADVRARVASILQKFAAIFARIGLKQHEAAKVAMGCPVLVAQVGGLLQGLIQCCSCLKSPPFVGEFVVYDLSPGFRWGAVAETPFIATFLRAPLRARAVGASLGVPNLSGVGAPSVQLCPQRGPLALRFWPRGKLTEMCV